MTKNPVDIKLKIKVAVLKITFIFQEVSERPIPFCTGNGQICVQVTIL